MSAYDPMQTSVDWDIVAKVPKKSLPNAVFSRYDDDTRSGAIMERRNFIKALVASAAAFPLDAHAQQPERMHRDRRADALS